MQKYSEIGREGLQALLETLRLEYESQKRRGIKLDMSRGKPGADQTALALPMLECVGSGDSTLAEDGLDCCNYGDLDGIPEAKRLMAELLDVVPGEVFVGGNSSLNLMHDVMFYCWLFPLPGCDKPWGKQETVKFLCPSPGYDRHFAITEQLGMELIAVPMGADGPDMDTVERLIQDPAVKGMWCVPKFSNPTGAVYSDDVVRRIAKMKPAAGDFRIFWDNSYAVHEFDGKCVRLLPLLPELRKYGNENNAFLFTSTSKITFPGAGISAVGASEDNINYIRKHMSLQTISFDKVNQLRHVRYLKNLDGVYAHMAGHMEIMRPKFEQVLEDFERALGGLGVASWDKPRGGYFITLYTMPGCAKRTLALCKDAGLVMTPAGATHPYGNEPDDKTIRVAPSYPSLDELKAAAGLFCLCVKIASAEKLLGIH